MRRVQWLVVALAGIAVSAPPAEAEAKKICGLYCDAVYKGCRGSIGLWDEEACESFHEGCLDGCDVNK
jgi:hypothetical protein